MGTKSKPETGKYKTRAKLVSMVLAMAKQPDKYPTRESMAIAAGTRKNVIAGILRDEARRIELTQPVLDVSLMEVLNKLWVPTQVPLEEEELV